MKKKKNPNDATFRNINALKHRVSIVEAHLKALTKLVMLGRKIAARRLTER